MLYMIAWYVIGLFGSVMGGLGDLKKGQDLTLGDALVYIGIAVSGPIIGILGLVHFFQEHKITNIVLLKSKNKGE